MSNEIQALTAQVAINTSTIQQAIAALNSTGNTTDLAAIRALTAEIASSDAALAAAMGNGQTGGTIPNLSSISLTPPTDVLQVGETRQLVAAGQFNDGQLQDVSRFVTWKSSDPSIVTVSVAGSVTAIGPGSSVLTATNGAVIGTTTVTVTGDVSGRVPFRTSRQF